MKDDDGQEDVVLDSRCGHEPTEPHTCPFRAEIHDNSTTLCTCCSECRHDCAMDV